MASSFAANRSRGSWIWTAFPSPYTTGLLDEFFDEKLTPMVQTSRGCPYSCTFCHDGIA